MYKNFFLKIQKSLCFVWKGKYNQNILYYAVLCSSLCTYISQKLKKNINIKETRRTNKSALIQIYRLLCALFLFTFDLYTQSQVDFVTRLSFFGEFKCNSFLFHVPSLRSKWKIYIFNNIYKQNEKKSTHQWNFSSSPNREQRLNNSKNK